LRYATHGASQAERFLAAGICAARSRCRHVSGADEDWRSDAHAAAAHRLRSEEARQEQPIFRTFDLLIAIRDKVSAVHDVVNEIKNMRASLASRPDRAAAAKPTPRSMSV